LRSLVVGVLREAWPVKTTLRVPFDEPYRV
jgi:hypothetical protein